MSARDTKRPLARLASLACLLIAPRLFAQTEGGAPRRAAPLSESLWGPAREAYEAATTLVASGDFAGALAKYKEGYEASRDPRLLFDMAICERDLHAYARMQGLLLRYLREGGVAISAEQRADIDSALTAIHALVGTVRLAVSEAGADVAVDGDSVGITPLGGPLTVDAGRHLVRVKKPGFETTEQSIEVPGGNETTVAITFVSLVPAARLVVSADASATVFVDQTVARGRFDARVPSGVHTLQVTEAGKRPYQAQINLADGDVRTLQVTLTDAPRRPIWPWLAGGAAVVAGAVLGGYFLFKSHDEPQGGPTGTLGTYPLPPP
jgi:hypothetical protein